VAAPTASTVQQLGSWIFSGRRHAHPSIDRATSVLIGLTPRTLSAHHKTVACTPYEDSKKDKYMSEQKSGVLIWWSCAKNYGVIQADDGERFFLHVSRIARGPVVPQADCRVTFQSSDVLPRQ
jgi:cold shock CspA family protein